MGTYTFTGEEILKQSSTFRRNFMNTLAGFKSANLVGTVNPDGAENVAIFNSVIHIGASPPFMGFVFRPHTVPRHTYENILSTGHYTFNHVSESMVEQAHQTAAKYDRLQSEFEACGLTAEYLAGFPAPFVKESQIKIGLKFEEEHVIKANQTILVVGQVIWCSVPEAAVSDDGFIRLETAETVAISGLDGYYTGQYLGRKEKKSLGNTPQ